MIVPTGTDALVVVVGLREVKYSLGLGEPGVVPEVTAIAGDDMVPKHVGQPVRSTWHTVVVLHTSLTTAPAHSFELSYPPL